MLRTWALVGNEQKDKKPHPAPQLLPPAWWGGQQPEGGWTEQPSEVTRITWRDY